MLPRKRVLQIIEDGKRRLGIEDMTFEVKYSHRKSTIGKRAEIFIWSEAEAEIVLYPEAAFFSVRHELCHAKLFRMGVLLTHTEKDLSLFPDRDDYARMVVVVEWYINELQRRVFHEYYSINQSGTPRPPPFHGLPDLPQERFSPEQISRIIKIVGRRS